MPTMTIKGKATSLDSAYLAGVSQRRPPPPPWVAAGAWVRDCCYGCLPDVG
ncbi:hypothetical protein GS641_14595, partial [Xanthomonas hortorum pv. gardneri]